MKNYFAIAFTCVYLTLTVGVAKTTHYCMGRDNNSSLFSFTVKKCGCALFEKAGNGCCHDEHEIVKIDDDQSGSNVLYSPAPEFNLIGELYREAAALSNEKQTSIPLSTTTKPPPLKVPFYKAFCSLVFYESIG